MTFYQIAMGIMWSAIIVINILTMRNLQTIKKNNVIIDEASKQIDSYQTSSAVGGSAVGGKYCSGECDFIPISAEHHDKEPQCVYCKTYPPNKEAEEQEAIHKLDSKEVKVQ